MQKSEFLKALSDMWKDFDSRVLRYKVWTMCCLIAMIFVSIMDGSKQIHDQGHNGFNWSGVFDGYDY